MESGLQKSYNALMKTIINPPVAILGFGVEGHSALAYLQGIGIKDITICDEKLTEAEVLAQTPILF